MAGLIGKIVANAVYVVPENVSTLPSGYDELIEQAEALIQNEPPKYNVLKISPKTSQVSLLEYDDLEKTPFPVLRQSTAINLEKGTVSQRSYKTYDNPPILHRKEVLFGETHPGYEEFALLTRTLEGFGLFGETARIGNQREWTALLESVGIEIDGHRVVRSNEISSDEAIDRHRTALVRSSLSAPIGAALRYELLTQARTLFDYGCGRGDDVALLNVDGFDAVGWDPYYAPEGEQRASDVVNLGYVLNVIENPSERVSVLQDAYRYAEKVLFVAALIDGQKSRTQAKRYRDGIITKRGTFQKFFTQMELRELIEASLKTEAISAGPGLFIVIRNEVEREEFLRTRHKRAQYNILPRISSRARRLVELTSEEDRDLASFYWELACDLGRLPRPAELPEHLLEWVTRKFGNPKKASAWLADHFGREGLVRAAKQKRGQLLSYLALAVFRRKKLRTLMTPELRREIKRMFGTLGEAQTEAFQTLRKMAEPETLANDCMEAADDGCALIDAKGRLLVHAMHVPELPPSLQAMIGVAEWLGEDLSSVDMVSVGAEYATVTFYRYRDFAEEPFPLLLSRLRVNLIKQTVRFLPEDRAGEARFFVGKSGLISDREGAQAPMDAAIQTVEPSTFATHMVDAETLLRLIGSSGRVWEEVKLGEFFRSLPNDRFDVSAFEDQILENAILPSLDDPCGRHLKYRDLIECGETQARTHLANLPKQPESYGALRELVLCVLDPVIEEYGMIELTYGFSSAELSREIPGRIAPKVDQHAACELNRRRNLICSRRGAAVDFIVEYESMLEVAQWIVEHCVFDRLYFYADDRPIHVSAGPENNGAVVLMKPRADGREGPVKISQENFGALTKF
jgi:DNA phosphorothioation-associated putative methyltransferase